MAKPTELQLTDEQTRDVIRATAVYARSLAAPEVREQNLPEIKRLDDLRHKIEEGESPSDAIPRVVELLATLDVLKEELRVALERIVELEAA